MANVPSSLFSWQDVESSDDIVRLHRVLAALPDQELIAALEAHRKGRRNRYPIIPIWHSLFAGLLFGHRSTAELIRELRRNAELRQVCGFDPVLGQEAVPSKFAYCRFLAALRRHIPRVEAIFQRLLSDLKDLLPDLGRCVAVDGKALPTRCPNDPEADTGIKTQTSPDGKQKIVFTWYGYKLHLLCDAVHELPLAFEVTTADTAESPRLIPLVKQLNREQPEILERTQQLAADRGYDDGEDKAALYDDYEIIPLIPARDCVQGVYKSLDERHHDTLYVSPTGEICCKVAPFESDPARAFCPMQNQGFEKDRQSLKFRCPAAAFGVECKNQAACRSHTKDQGFGRVVRVALELDRRLHTPLYQHSQSFKDAYKTRTSIERLFYRLDHLYGFEYPTQTGLANMQLRVAMALTAMLATAKAWIEAKKVENIRSRFQAA